MGDNVSYVIARRVGDFDEYLQRDGDFGPLVVETSYTVRTNVTRHFQDQEHAEAVLRAWERRYPTVAPLVPLEVRRVP